MNKFVYVKLHASRSLLVCLAIKSGVIKNSALTASHQGAITIFFLTSLTNLQKRHQIVVLL